MTSTDDENTGRSTPPMVETEKAAPPGFLPSPWLMFYSLTLFLGGLYLLSVAFALANQFVVLSFIAALVAILTGTLLWLRRRIALIGYVILALGFLGFACFRLFTEGYTTGRLGLVIGPLLMLTGFSSIVEELPPKRP